MSKLNHSPAPWEYETVQSREDRSAYAVVKDANGDVLFDTLNSDAAVIHEEHDEDGVHRWDETGRVNLALAAASPELLAVLLDARQYVAICAESSLLGADANRQAAAAVLERIEAVILKAKGQR